MRIGFFSFLSSFPIDPVFIPWLRSDTTTSMQNWWVHPLLFDSSVSFSKFRFRWFLTLFLSSGSSRGHGCWEIQPRFALCQGSISWISGCFSNFLFDFFVLIAGGFSEFKGSPWVVRWNVFLGLFWMMKILTKLQVFRYGGLCLANSCWFAMKLADQRWDFVVSNGFS